MKKTFQINLGGINFNIEEEAYKKLNQYLDAIKNYFKSYEGADEIVADIEYRIAEKLFDKDNLSKVVETEDIQKIMQSMGSLADFEAVKEDDDLAKAKIEEPKTTATGTAAHTKFYRDGVRKALGGVLAGLAHMLNIDVVWVRVLYILITFGLIDIGGIGGFFFLAYFVCWIVMPERNDLIEDSKIKKFFRNPENKALGGVASGLATYLNIDLVIVRIIFVIMGFFGVGILIYIVFWIVVPNAHTITQKMEQKGQALTLSNIENTIKSEAQISPTQETRLGTALLWPFRMLRTILSALGFVLKPVGSIIKLFAGLLLLVFGLSIALTAVIGTGVFFGIFSENSSFISGGEIFSLFRKDLPIYSGFFAFILLFVPAAAISIAGLSMLTGTRYGNRNFWLTSLLIWFSGLVGAAAIGSRYAMNFSKTSSFEEETSLNLPAQTILLDRLDNTYEDDDDDDNFNHHVVVNINTSTDTTFRLVKTFKASGRSKSQAKDFAKNIEYKFEQKDSLVAFDDEFTIKGERFMRDQNVTLNLQIPIGKKFKLSRDFAEHLFGQRWALKEKYGVHSDELHKFTFVMKENDEIQCIDCPVLTDEEKEKYADNNDQDFAKNLSFNTEGLVNKNFNNKNFDEISIGGNFKCLIEAGDSYKLEIFGNDDDIKNVEIDQSGKSLEISYKDPFSDQNDEIIVKITCPKLSEFDLSGASTAKVLGFKDSGKIDVQVSGSSQLALSTEIKQLDINISGASTAEVSGVVKDLNADLSGASTLNMKKVDLDNVEIDASGASYAKLGKVKNNYSVHNEGASEVTKEN